MRVLLAFDKFKDSLTAPAACEIAAFALRREHPDWTLDLCPLADGGEGFCEILTAAASGELKKFPVTGPRGGTVEAPIGFVRCAKIPAAARAHLGLDHAAGEVAVIEMAAASGLALLPQEQRDPWQTTTLGTGQLIRAATEAGVAVILLGVGGSATHDLGLGALSALGVSLVDGDGQKLAPPIPSRWSRGTRFVGNTPTTLPPIRIACDVTNPLLGPRGAAAVYGPQKGLRPEDFSRLDHESARLALTLCLHAGQPDTLMDVPGAGAAGGISFGLMAAARAKLLPGFDLVSAWLDIERRVAAADLVITGEGRFDESSLSGKGPGAVAARALALGKQVHVFAGAVTATARDRLALHAITPPGTPLAEALRAASSNLAATLVRALPAAASSRPPRL
jgi:glycerate kinase